MDGIERWLEPALVRIAGLNRLDDERPGDTTRTLLEAIEIARRQQAKSWELRCSASLARMWMEQGEPGTCCVRSTKTLPKRAALRTCARRGPYSTCEPGIPNQCR